MQALNFGRPMTWLPVRALTLALPILLVSLGACERSDECRGGEIRCAGDLAMNCGNVADRTGEYLAWQKTLCGAGKCKLDLASNDAFCARDTAPEPRCDQEHAGFCDGTTLTSCRAGYVVATQDCAASAPEPRYCVQLGRAQASKQPLHAICASEPEPNPLCDDGNAGSTDSCDGDDVVVCQHGYLLAKMRCAEGSSCRPYGICSKYGTADNATPSRGEQRASN